MDYAAIADRLLYLRYNHEHALSMIASNLLKILLMLIYNTVAQNYS
jgi:hypothetical protein